MAEPTPTPIGLVVKLPYDSPEDFLARYGANITFGGIYLRSKSVKPPGTPVTLDLQLTSGTRLLYASAVVHFVTGQAGQGISGMGLRFLAMDVASREFLERAAASAPHLASPHPPVPPNVGTPDYTVPAELGAEQPPPAEPPSPAPAEALGRLPELPSEEPERTGTIIGIDLGTTNSCVAAMRNGRPALLLSREGHRTVPSIVALNSRNKLVVGHPAKGQMLTNPRQTVYGSKRLIGRSYDSPFVQQIKDRFSYEIVPGAHGESAVRLGDRMYSLQQISALILREVKEVAQNQLGEPVSRAVITVPAYYNDNQRQAVREAGRLAGLYVERIVNEPTAAALAYGYGRRLHQRLLVYDLGGGTFDASVLQLKDNLYEVISTGGDTFLGGIDFDNAIVEHLLEHFQRATGRPFQGDRVALQRLHDAAERAKCSLSEITQARVYVPFLTLVDDKPYDLDVTLTRDTLIALTERLVDRTLEVCQQVLAAKGLTVQDLDEVLLVGGQSRFPLVHEKVTKFFGKPPSKSVHPDEAVAMGAALLAHSLGANEGVTLVDVLPMSIGVGLPGGRFKPVLEHNVRLPVAKTYRIATTRDDQAYVEMSVYQGDSERTQDNEYLGTLKLEGLPPGPRGSVKVGITFEVDTECTLRVTARELSTGAEVSSTFAMRRTATEAAGGKAVLEQTVHSYRLPGSSPSSTSIPAVGGRTPPVLSPTEASAEAPPARRQTGSFAAVQQTNPPPPAPAEQPQPQQGSKRLSGWFKRILDE